MKARGAVLRIPLSWLLWVLPALAVAATDGFAPVVYTDANLTVHAGIATEEGQIVQLGDVMSLVIRISWNADEVTLEEPGEQFFSEAWSGDFAPVVLDTRQTRRSGDGPRTDEWVYVVRFQVVSCPAAAPTCPGERRYRLPELTVRYRSDPGAEPIPVTFRPEPGEVTVMTTIDRDADNRLHPFSHYFPSGAYPDPFPTADRTRAALTTLGAGSIMLIGGILMWPFRFRRKQLFVTGKIPRWKAVLDDLQHEDGADERRLADRMRRCLVWYCSDALNVDPFEWLEPDDGGADVAHADLRDLFIDLLHDPAGRGPELRARLASLVTDRA